MTDAQKILNYIETLDNCKQVRGKLTEAQAEILLNLFPADDIIIQLEHMETYASTKRSPSLFFAIKRNFEDDVRFGKYIFQNQPFENKSGWVFKQPKPEPLASPFEKGGTRGIPSPVYHRRHGGFKSVADVMESSGFPLRDPVADRRAEFLKKHPVGSEYTHTTGTVFIVESESMLRNKADDSCLPIAMIIR